jgi:hypothetical protein
VNIPNLLDNVDNRDLTKLTVFFYLDKNDTIPVDKEIIVIAEDGLNGVSAIGLEELYYASATEDEDLPSHKAEDGTLNT